MRAELTVQAERKAEEGAAVSRAAADQRTRSFLTARRLFQKQIGRRRRLKAKQRVLLELQKAPGSLSSLCGYLYKAQRYTAALVTPQVCVGHLK